MIPPTVPEIRTFDPCSKPPTKTGEQNPDWFSIHRCCTIMVPSNNILKLRTLSLFGCLFFLSLFFQALIWNFLVPVDDLACQSQNSLFQDRMGNRPISSSSSSKPSSPISPKTTKLGVFVLKVKEPHEALRSLCILDRFFNRGPKYAIRIFADSAPSNATLDKLVNLNPDVDLQVIVDHEETWKQLPAELSEFERDQIRPNCSEQECTTRKFSIGYVHMGYWRYRVMAYEESLQGFEYFISWDIDAYLLQPWQHDPFLVMQHNNLTGFFVQDNTNHGYHQGVAQALERVFGKAKRNVSGFVNSPESFPYFDPRGTFNARSIYGYLYGGRLDFFRTKEFREFGRQMVPYTYKYRVDEQVVIGAAWSMMATDKVWYFPSRGYPLGVWHYGSVDGRRLLDCTAIPPPPDAVVVNLTERGLCYWENPSISGQNPYSWKYQQSFDFHVPGSWADYRDLTYSLLPSQNQKLTQEYGDCLCLPTKHLLQPSSNCSKYKHGD